MKQPALTWINTPEERNLLKIILIYIFVAGAWIIFSDRGLHLFVQDHEALTQMQTYKGWTYVLVTAGMLYHLIRRYVNNIRQAKDALEASEHKYRTLVENIPQKIFHKDRDSRYISCNDSFALDFHVSPDEITGRTDGDFFPRETAEKYQAEDRTVMASGKTLHLDRIYALEGRETVVHTVKTPVKNETGEITGVLGISWDITEEKEAQEKILRANRLYNVSSRINQMVFDMHERDQLFKNVCRIAVEYGGFTMAWLGVVDPDTRTVKPVAHCGPEQGYLYDITVSTADVPEGRGPTGTAIREGRYVICNDIENNPSMRPWRSEARKHGYRSSAAFPIALKGAVIGALNIYSRERDFYGAEEILLLQEIANGISHTLEYRDEKERRADVEEEMRKLNAELRECQETIKKLLDKISISVS